MEDLFSTALDEKLTQQIVSHSKERIDYIIEQERKVLESAGIDPSFLNAGNHESGIEASQRSQPCKMKVPLQNLQIADAEEDMDYSSVPHDMNENSGGVEEKNHANSDSDSEFYIADEDEDMESMVGSLGGDEEKFEEMDTELPEEARSDFLLPEEDEEQMEEDMESIKDKDGNETSYEDDFMNDIQAEADDDFEGQDDIMAAASASFSDDDDLEGGAVGSSKEKKASVADDTPTGEEGFVPDVLPSDFGMDGVSGDDKNAAAFFASAFSGQQGDKSRRNQVKRKRIKKGL
jgi:hypothetical protein